MKTIIFGIKDMASLAHFYFKNDSNHNIIAFSVDSNYLTENNFENLPVIAFEEIEKEFPPDDYCFFIPMYNNYLRADKFNIIRKKGYKTVNYISSKATVFTEKIGTNCFIMENNVLQPYSSIGNNVVLWSGNHIGHHSIIKDHVFFASHVVLSGHCTVKSYCWLGVNATIKDGLTLAEGTILGMSACITKNTENYKTYIGIPARIL